MTAITASPYPKFFSGGLRTYGLLLIFFAMETPTFAQDKTALYARMQTLKEDDPEWTNEVAPNNFTAITITHTDPRIGYVWKGALDIKSMVEEYAKSEEQPIWRSKEGGAKGTPPVNSSRRRFQFTLASGKSEQIASRSDDGISIFVTEYNSKGDKLGTRQIMNNFKKGMHFPTTAES